MREFRYPPLEYAGHISDDLDRLIPDRTDVDTVMAVELLKSLCSGNSGRGYPAAYAASARTVWIVQGDGVPPPTVNVFEWGGDLAGVPACRIWYLEARNAQPVGLGTFAAAARRGRYPGEDEVLVRIQAKKGAGCSLEDGNE